VEVISVSVTAVKRLSGPGPRGLAIVLSEHGTATTIVLEGEWDLAQQRATREAIHAALDRSPDSVVLDLSGVSFIDSSGLHVLVALNKRADSENIRLAIVPGPRPVQRLFEVCGLLDVLPFVGAGHCD
jgi:anti-anti-sigma factor